MAETEPPRLYLITPSEFELARFPDQLAAVLDAHPVACLRLALSTHDEDTLCRAAETCRAITTPRDVALVIERHVVLAERLGLDGVHLTDAARSVRAARKSLGPDAIIGAFCHASRHDGMSAGEAGADYISFGPVGASSLGDGSRASHDLFAWWSEMIEVPVVAEGALDGTALDALADVTDFIALGEEIWHMPDPEAALSELIKHITL
ncbi:MAG: thiamine phosphate synthase [Pseudomonadota bacterium]